MAEYDKTPTLIYKRYKSGYDYNLKIGYYTKVTENENYINGEQWLNVQSNGLPTPVFNIEKRIMDYKIAALSSQKVKAVYGIEGITQHGDREPDVVDEAYLIEQELNEVAKLMSGNAEVRWEKLKMDSLVRRWLRDGFVTGDMFAHVYWDANLKTGQKAKGDFVTERISGSNVIFGNPNEPSVEKQPWIVIPIRDTVENLKAEAAAAKVPKEQIELITPDTDTESQIGRYGQIEIEGDDSTGKCNAYLMYFKDGGKVYWSKATKYVTIQSKVDTKIQRYPIAHAVWDEVENCYHGKAECSEIHPNQRFINKMFAMCMVWFMYNSFGKVAYDATRISAWTNDIGSAIAVNGPVDGVV